MNRSSRCVVCKNLFLQTQDISELKWRQDGVSKDLIRDRITRSDKSGVCTRCFEEHAYREENKAIKEQLLQAREENKAIKEQLLQAREENKAINFGPAKKRRQLKSNYFRPAKRQKSPWRTRNLENKFSDSITKKRRGRCCFSATGRTR